MMDITVEPLTYQVVIDGEYIFLDRLSRDQLIATCRYLMEAEGRRLIHTAHVARLAAELTTSQNSDQNQSPSLQALLRQT